MTYCDAFVRHPSPTPPKYFIPRFIILRQRPSKDGCDDFIDFACVSKMYTAQASQSAQSAEASGCRCSIKQAPPSAPFLPPPTFYRPYHPLSSLPLLHHTAPLLLAHTHTHTETHTETHTATHRDTHRATHRHTHTHTETHTETHTHTQTHRHACNPLLWCLWLGL